MNTLQHSDSDKENEFNNEIYPNIIIRTLENKLAIAESRELNEISVTVDVMKDILTLLKNRDIVLCEDCEYYNSLMGTCHDGTKHVSPYFYCGEGERAINWH